MMKNTGDKNFMACTAIKIRYPTIILSQSAPYSNKKDEPRQHQ